MIDLYVRTGRFRKVIIVVDPSGESADTEAGFANPGIESQLIIAKFFGQGDPAG
jgi:hypothetical protein